MAKENDIISRRVLSFGAFRLYPASREIYREDERVRIGSRALDILVVLVERAGELVGKQELGALVWPDRAPDDSTLRWHVSELRRVLAGSFIVSVQGRGYRFVEPVVRGDEPIAEIGGAAVQLLRGATAPLTRLVGRTENIQELVELLGTKRLVTVTGTGGVGKTKLALAAAGSAAGTYRDGAAFLDLPLIADPALLPAAVLSLLGLPAPVDTLLDALTDQRLLLVFDSAECMIETLAPFVERILAAAPNVDILATSREPLRSAAEWVYRLPPLEIPLADPSYGAEEALRFPSVALFVERARASLSGFVLTDADVPLVCNLCRRLDGIPLAIELAAGQIGFFGLHGLAQQLGKRFAILSHGRRTAITRHQTLRQTLDWSYDLLSPAERVLFHRLSLFRGTFTAGETASACICPVLDGAAVVATLAALVSKSLVASEEAADGATYRLLDTAREYARSKLDLSDDAPRVLRQFALHLDRSEVPLF